MKKKIILFVLCGIVLLGVCGCGNKYDRNVILDNSENLKAYCKSVLPSGVYETKLVGNDKQTVLKGYEEIKTIDKLCSIEEELIKGYDENATFSCSERDGDTYKIKYEYLVNTSIEESVKELEEKKYSCIIYNKKITDEKILGTWCWHNEDGTLVNGNYKLILNSDGTMKETYNYGGSWGENSNDTYYSFDGSKFYYLSNTNTKIEYTYNEDDNTLRADSKYSSNNKYYQKCD